MQRQLSSRLDLSGLLAKKDVQADICRFDLLAVLMSGRSGIVLLIATTFPDVFRGRGLHRAGW